MDKFQNLNANRFKILIQSSLRELTKSKRKSFKYFVIVEETILDTNAKNYYLAYYKSKKTFTKNPLKSLFKINLNDCVCIYNHDVARSKTNKLSKQKASAMHHYHLHHQHHHHAHTGNTPKKRPHKLQQSTIALQCYYTLFIYTLDDYLFISFDKNEKLRLNWYTLLNRLSRNLHHPLKIYQISLKIKSIDASLTDSAKSLLNLASQRKGCLNSRICFNEDSNDFIYLLILSSKNLVKHYEQMSLNVVEEDANLIKFPITHIKRIGHDKSNRFFIELGKRSIYGQLVFIFKCLNYDLACYLHRKTFQFIDKYKEQQQEQTPSVQSLTRSSRSTDNVTAAGIARTPNAAGYTRFNSFSSFLNQAPAADKHSKSTPGNTIKRYYTLFSRNSSKLKTHVSDVFKRLSLSKLSNSTDKLSTSKCSDQNSTISSCNLNGTKVSNGEDEDSFNRLDYVEHHADNTIKSNSEDRFQARSNTDGCIVMKTLQKTSLSTSFGFLDCRLEATTDSVVNKQVFRDRVSTLDSIRLESGYESNSLRSSSCASSNKDAGDIYYEMNYKRKHVNSTLTENSGDSILLNENDELPTVNKILDTYSFAYYDERENVKETTPKTKKQSCAVDETQPSCELIEMEPPFQLS